MLIGITPKVKLQGRNRATILINIVNSDNKVHKGMHGRNPPKECTFTIHKMSHKIDSILCFSEFHQYYSTQRCPEQWIVVILFENKKNWSY